VKHIHLDAWAETRYSPPPSQWVLRKWCRQGEIYPAPERVGREWYVREDAQRLSSQPASLVDRLRAA